MGRLSTTHVCTVLLCENTCLIFLLRCHNTTNLMQKLMHEIIKLTSTQVFSQPESGSEWISYWITTFTHLNRTKSYSRISFLHHSTQFSDHLVKWDTHVHQSCFHWHKRHTFHMRHMSDNGRLTFRCSFGCLAIRRHILILEEQSVYFNESYHKC